MKARRRSRRLIVWFVIIYVCAIGCAVLGLHKFGIGLAALSNPKEVRQPGVRAAPTAAAAESQPAWDPRVLALCAAVVTAGFVGLMWSRWRELRQGGCAVALELGARRLGPDSTQPAERRLLNIVEEMALASGQPVPAVFVLDAEKAINACAIGLTPEDAALVLTGGALAKLSREELQAVVAHEFSHLLSGDTRLNLWVTVWLAGLMAVFAYGVTTIFRTKTRGLVSWLVKVLLAVGVAAVGVCLHALGRLVQAAICRQREFLADAAAVQFTRNPLGLIQALSWCGEEKHASAHSDTLAGDYEHFLFAPAKRPRRSRLLALWNTHPSFAARISAVRQMSGLSEADIPPRRKVHRIHPQMPQAAPVARPRRKVPPPPPSQPATAPPPTPLPLLPSAGAALGANDLAPQLCAAIGSLAADQIAQSASLLASIAPPLLDAVRSEAQAPAVLCCLLLDADTAIRQRQFAVLEARASAATVSVVKALEPYQRDLPPAARLPLVQLALPALKLLPSQEREVFRQLLRQLVEADARVSVFEYALQRFVDHALAAAAEPGRVRFAQYHSIHGVTRDVAVLLSALARVANDVDPTPAFASGARSLGSVLGGLALVPAGECAPPDLTRALDRLALATLPIKQHVVAAAAHVVCADGRVYLEEFELLRVLVALLDVPMPMLRLEPPPEDH